MFNIVNNMRKGLYTATYKLMLEVVKERDLDLLTDYFDYLNDCYSYEEAMNIVEKVAAIIFDKDPDLYEWLIVEIQNVYAGSEEVINFVIHAKDLIHLLITEGDKVRGKDFYDHPTDSDKVVVTSDSYVLLKNILKDIFSDEDTIVNINIDDMVEVVEVV